MIRLFASDMEAKFGEESTHATTTKMISMKSFIEIT
jgi:hypothetical protein